MLKRQEIRDKKSAPSLQGAQCPQAEPERLSKAPSIPSAWQEWESITPSPPAFPSLLLGRAWSWMCRGLCGNSSGSKTQKGVRVDSWAPCYGIICGTLVFLLPFILPSVKQAFSLFLPDFLPCIPTATLFSCRGGLATRAHWCKEIWLLPCPALHIFPWWDVVLAAPP